MCPSDLYSAFNHSSCFRVDHTFICEEDMQHITDSMCVDVANHQVCGHELYALFHGDDVVMHDGHNLTADFASEHHDPHSDLCRRHMGIEYCLSTILDLYSAPHDCVMFGGEWLCQKQMT